MTWRRLGVVVALGCAGLVAFVLLRTPIPAAEPSGHEAGDPPDRTIVAIDSRGNFYINALPVAPKDLVPRVQRALEDKKERLVYLKADKHARYAAVLEAMDALHEAKIEHVAL